MLLFKFKQDTPQSLFLTQGEAVTGASSIQWVERYRKAGEFTIKAPVSSNLRERLPLYSLVSHTDTSEVMVVETHEISENDEGESEITISGRSLEVLLEDRVSGTNRSFPLTPADPLPIFTHAANYTWVQAVNILNSAFIPTYITDDRILGIIATHSVTGTGVSVERPNPRGEWYNNVLDILAVDDLGIKTVRPGPKSPYFGTADAAKLVFVVHKGENKAASVGFSYDAGDLADAGYLWSIENHKNCALVTGKFLETMVYGSQTGYRRRIMYVDGKDIDGGYNTLVELQNDVQLGVSALLAKMATLGNQALSAQKEVSITSVEIKENNRRYAFRKDYNVGDIVAVYGNYDTATQMRVSEYVEIDDIEGARSYPTLSGI